MLTVAPAARQWSSVESSQDCACEGLYCIFSSVNNVIGDSLKDSGIEIIYLKCFSDCKIKIVSRLDKFKAHSIL